MDGNRPLRYERQGRTAVTLEELHIMLQNLLADQFKLQFHHETKELRVTCWWWISRKGGIKMQHEGVGIPALLHDHEWHPLGR